MASRGASYSQRRPRASTVQRAAQARLIDNAATNRPALVLCASTALLAGAVTFAAASSSAPRAVGAASPAVELVPGVRGLRAPVGVTASRSEPGRLYVVEQRGLVRVAQGGRLRPEPFLDLRSVVLDQGLAGLLSLAFAPEYARTRLVYADYVGRDRDVHVVEYRSNGRRALPASGREVLHVAVPSKTVDNHHGGQLAFGPDGRLYVGVGDGNSSAAAQDPASLLGKLVRIDIGRDPIEPEIVAYGLRNPWRFSFDRRTGDLYVGDVGADTWEEVDYLRRGTRWPVNLGWPAYGGRSRTNEPAPIASGHLVFPILVYRHRGKGCRAVVGGYVYRGRAVPGLRGRYVFGDFCTATVSSVRVFAGHARSLRPEAQLGSLLSSFGEDARGELYVCAYSSTSGTVFRLVQAPA